MVGVTKRRVKRGWMKLRIKAIHDETHDTKTFSFEDEEEGGRPFDFFPAQYLTFRYDDIGERPLVRSYTMSGSPCQADDILVTVKRVDKGVVSNWMCDQLRPGMVLKARGPIGKFTYRPEEDQPHLVMVAAGSGITPFTSIIREYGHLVGQPGQPKSLSLLVSQRTTADLINSDVLGPASQLPGVRIVTTLSRQTAAGFWKGRIDDVMLKEFSEGKVDWQNSTFMTCGPEEMMQCFLRYCRQQGAREQNLKCESFEN